MIEAVAVVIVAVGWVLFVADLGVGILRWGRRRSVEAKGLRTMSDWPGVNEAAPYVWTGGAGVVGRLMFHARQVQQGKRKPLSWALLFDLPIALAMGWIVYGVCVWLRMEPHAHDQRGHRGQLSRTLFGRPGLHRLG